MRAEYDRIFGLVVPKECPPYETEYYPTQETFARSQQMADIAGFYRAFGIEPARSSPERPDHLALELEFMAFLLLKKREAVAATDVDPRRPNRQSICDRALPRFLPRPPGLVGPDIRGGPSPQGWDRLSHALAGVLAAWIPAECRRLNISAVLRPVHPGPIEEPEELSGCAACPLQL